MLAEASTQNEINSPPADGGDLMSGSRNCWSSLVLQLCFSGVNDGVRIFRNDLRIDILLKIFQCDDFVLFQLQVLQVSFKVLLAAADPVMSCIWNAVELQNGDSTVASLFSGSD